jgi:hypothetical protein
MRKVKIYHVRQIILTKNFLRIICNKRCDMNSNLRQIGFLTSNLRLYIKFFIAVFPWIVLSRSTMSFFCSYGKRTGVISGFGGMGDKFDLVSPPTANKVIAKTFLEDSYNIINNVKKPYMQ